MSAARRRRRPGPDTGPQPVGQSLDAVLGRMGASPSRSTTELVFSRWSEVVGPDLVDHLHPVRVQDAALLIVVEHPAWATRARMEGPQILQRLDAMGDRSITRIDVVVQRPS